jgi:post-segregation antitoxin (ccd killing protein)
MTKAEEEWLAANQEAIDWTNAYVREHGLPLWNYCVLREIIEGDNDDG